MPKPILMQRNSIFLMAQRVQHYTEIVVQVAITNMLSMWSISICRFQLNCWYCVTYPKWQIHVILNTIFKQSVVWHSLERKCFCEQKLFICTLKPFIRDSWLLNIPIVLFVVFKWNWVAASALSPELSEYLSQNIM